MAVKFNEIEGSLVELSSFFMQLPNQIKYLEKEVQLCNLETSDLLHLIELDNFNASDGFKHAKDLQITRQKRRELKDELEILSDLQENLKTNRPFTHQVDAINKLSIQRQKRMKTRGYTPRIRSDLKSKFVECKKKQLLKGE